MPKKTVKVTSTLRSIGLYHRGEMATFFMAEYSRNDQKYEAISKQVRYTGEMGEEAAKEFCDIRDERWKTLYQLRHSNVVQYYDGFFKHMLIPEDTPPQALLVMEFLPGSNLGQLLEKDDLPRTLVLDYLKQILFGLEYLNTKRVIHAHLNPDNLFLSDCDSFGIHRTIKLGGLDDSVMFDFSPRKPEEADDEPGGETDALKKAARFLAPEVAWHLRQDTVPTEMVVRMTTKADIWSLGITFLDMACYSGKTTFTREKSGVLQRKRLHANGAVDAETVIKFIADGGVPEVPIGLPKTFQGFWERCLLVNPRMRPSATELLSHAVFTGSVRRVGEYLI